MSVDNAARGLALKAAPALYLGQVGTRCYIPTTFNGTNKQLMARNPHYARDTIVSPQIGIPNWYWNGSAETGTGGVATVTGSIEYPVGTFTQMKFGGSASGSIASGATAFSDPVPVTIPNGALYYSRIFYTNAAGIAYFAVFGTGGVDPRAATNFAVSGMADQTMSGTVAAATTFICFGPCAIIGQTRRPSIAFIGDSRMIGQNDNATDATGETGHYGRFFAPGFGCMNLGSPGDKAQLFITGSTLRRALAAYCSHWIVGYGINDIVAGRSAINLRDDFVSIAGLATGKVMISATLPPDSSSTDSWATLANQTSIGNNAARIAFNALARGGIAGCSDCFDIADALESSRDSGKWIVNGTANYATNDGLHEQAAVNVLLTRAGILHDRGMYRVNPK